MNVPLLLDNYKCFDQNNDPNNTTVYHSSSSFCELEHALTRITFSLDKPICEQYSIVNKI